ncbi:glycine betaine/proline transport system substrate-binding protein [Natronobacillus azotifigens]|uniref:Glycine betaine ABC transporter substrate-binding protein n=1 Tax=Natronobacillus azotifigens TaxID=472978 RepID=A0A9J6RD66_9BACI|nr:glycine betaine ABC transporter substrate-binding protein [Natronobacillus azotifigens]MCZ0703310.1 glycine betaine ABC transporter substrate-binding protein [Natronobacillus azotifigens]
MFKLQWKHLGLLLVLMLSLVLAACGTNDENGDDTTNGDEVTNGDEGETGDDVTGIELGEESIELVYVEWDSEIASTNVIAQVLESQGYDVTITPIDNAIMWSSVATGDADGMVAAWLPGTHGELFEQHQDNLVQLGPNLEGAGIGLVVPEYMDVTSIADLADYDGLDSITGIEPGAGVVQAAEDALDDYNLDGWSVDPSSSGAMAVALGEAINNEEPIVVTGWTPHWKFAQYDLKYLEDPEGSFGGAESIETMVREGLEQDSPAAYHILDQFFWEPSDMEEVMLEITDGVSEEDAAANWIAANQDKVDEWIAGLE